MSRESFEVSEQAFWEQFDHKEVNKFGCYPGEPITHRYPSGRIITGNESINWSEPF